MPTEPTDPTGPAVPAEPVHPDDQGQEVLLRPALSEDLDAVAALYLAARAAAPMPPPVNDETAVRAWVHGLPERHEVWVAEVGVAGGLVGFAAYDEHWLDSLYVHPDHQGRGVGSMLLDVVTSTRPEGFGLWVFAENTPARAFYAARGLVELETTDGSANDEGAPDVRLAWLGDRPLTHLRDLIDGVDEELAGLLARRVALTAAVQDQKLAAGTGAGRSDRDAEREREIVERMAAAAPGLDRGLLARVMHTLIESSLAVWESRSRP